MSFLGGVISISNISTLLLVVFAVLWARLQQFCCHRLGIFKIGAVEQFLQRTPRLRYSHRRED